MIPQYIKQKRWNLFHIEMESLDLCLCSYPTHHLLSSPPPPKWSLFSSARSLLRSSGAVKHSHSIKRKLLRFAFKARSNVTSQLRLNKGLTVSKQLATFLTPHLCSHCSPVWNALHTLLLFATSLNYTFLQVQVRFHFFQKVLPDKSPLVIVPVCWFIFNTSLCLTLSHVALLLMSCPLCLLTRRVATRALRLLCISRAQ